MSTFHFPLSPTDKVIEPIRPGNPMLDWINLKDSAGASVSHFRVMLDAPFYNVLANTLYLGVVEVAYNAYLLMSTFATAALRPIAEPSIWLDPLSRAYISVTTPLYQYVSPKMIIIAAFAILILQVFVVRSGPTQGAARQPGAKSLKDQWIPAGTQISRAQWDRLWSGLVLMMLVWVVTANPFKLIKQLLEVVFGFTNLFSDAGPPLTDSNVDMIRTVTFLINYRDILGPDCTEQWAAAINSYGSNPSCLTPSQAAATSPDIWTAALSVLALPVGWYLLKFARLALLRFLNYMSLAVLYLVAVGYVAAVTLGRRRPYDPLVTTGTHLATNAGMAVAVYAIVKVIPPAIFGLIDGFISLLPDPDASWLIGTIAVAKVAAITFAYYLSSKILDNVFEIKETVASVFKDRIAKSSLVTNLYDRKSTDPSFAAPLLAAASGGEWAKEQYRNAAQWSTTRWKKNSEHAGSNPRGERTTGGTMTEIAAETPQMEGAQQRFTLAAPPEGTLRPAVELDTLAAAAAARKQAPAQTAPVVVLNSQGQRLPAPTPDQRTTVIYRGGIPMIVEQQPTPAPPPLSGPQQPAPATPTASAQPAPETAAAAYHQQLRTDATWLRPTTAPAAPSPFTEIDASTTTYSSAVPGAAAPEPATLAAMARKLGILQGPNFSMLLSPSAWTRGVRHQQNLLAARGKVVTPRLSEESEATEHVLFIQQDGKNRVVRKHDRGFGDVI